MDVVNRFIAAMPSVNEFLRRNNAPPVVGVKPIELPR